MQKTATTYCSGIAMLAFVLEEPTPTELRGMRLKQVMAAKGRLKATAIANAVNKEDPALGWDEQTVYNITGKNKRRQMSDYEADILARVYAVDSDWLKSGRGTMEPNTGGTAQIIRELLSRLVVSVQIAFDLPSQEKRGEPDMVEILSYLMVDEKHGTRIAARARKTLLSDQFILQGEIIIIQPDANPTPGMVAVYRKGDDYRAGILTSQNALTGNLDPEDDVEDLRGWSPVGFIACVLPRGTDTIKGNPIYNFEQGIRPSTTRRQLQA